MVDAAQFEASLGKAEDTPEVGRLFAALGITQRPKLEDGKARATLYDQGLVLILAPENEKSSKLVLRAVQMYSDLEAKFTTFAGALPGGVLFTDSMPEVHDKLGKPTQSKKEYRMDHWIADGRRTTVRYNKTLDRVAYVELGFPIQ